MNITRPREIGYFYNKKNDNMAKRVATEVAKPPVRRKKKVNSTSCSVIDTSAWIDDPLIVYQIGKKSDVHITIDTLDILSRFKDVVHSPGNVMAAGEALTVISNILGEGRYLTIKGAPIPGTPNKLFIDSGFEDASVVFKKQRIANFSKLQPLALCKYLQKDYDQVAFFTKDKALRMQSKVLGIKASDYETDIDLYVGNPIYEKESEIMALNPKTLPLGKYFTLKGEEKWFWKVVKNRENKEIKKFSAEKDQYSGIVPLNVEQAQAADALADDFNKVVTLFGPPGTGKNLLAILYGVKSVIEKKCSSIIITRSMTPVEEEGIGFLPGTAEEKISPYMQAFNDNVDEIREIAKEFFDKHSDFKNKFEDVVKNKLKAIPLDLMRGRSFARKFVIVDESQNTTTHAMRMILTRMSRSSRIVIMGDNSQIDAQKHLDSRTNGLVKAINHFKEFNTAAHIVLRKDQRSDVSRHASTMK